MDIPEIGVDELAERLDAGAFLLDVRNPAEWEDVRVPGAVLVPLTELPARLEELPANGEILVICRSGARSLSACEHLRHHGRVALNVAGGTLAWVEADRPVESGPAAV